MSHILFISPYYPPEKAAAAVCVSENAKRLAMRGHQVTVLTTFPNYPTGVIPPEYRGRLIQQEMRDGVRVVRVWSYTSANKGFLRRILAHLSFGCLAPVLGGAKIGHPDVIIAQSPPLFDAIAVRLLARRKRCPFIFMVSDLWPESAVQLGALRNRLCIWLAECLEWSTYQRAALVWAVTDGMRETLLRRGLAPEQVLLLTNGVDTQKFRPLSKEQARVALGWDERFVVLYAGTHGLSHGLTTVLAAAEQIQHRDDIRIVLVGDGAEKAHLLELAGKRKIKNVAFLNPFPHDQVPQLLAAADVCLAHVRDLPIFKGMLPIKMYEAMACARPIILALNGEARRVAVQEAGAALYVEPENASALASAILTLRENPAQAECLGLRGRAYVDTHFSYDVLVEALDAHIASLLNAHGASRPEALTSANVKSYHV